MTDTTSFDLFKLDRYREGNRLEFKEAKGGFPKSFWETYSSFANTWGGLIVLGAAKETDGHPTFFGLKNPAGLVKDLWNGLNNEQKVSANLLLDSDVTQVEVDGKVILLVRVPRADRTQRPVYINDNPKRGSFRRNGEGDYHCSEEELLAMARDSDQGTPDKAPLASIGLDALNTDSIHAYRNVFASYRLNHPWTDLVDEEFLLRLGAVGRSEEDGLIHATKAGLLMFGEAWRITDEYPNYFLDYRDETNATWEGADGTWDVCGQRWDDRRWDDRLTSSDGDWTGNVYDFYRRASLKLTEGLPVPFAVDATMHRLSDTPQHKALREALVNALVHADYYGRTGVVAVRHTGYATFSDPGGLRIPADVVEGGGVSDPRNPTLFTMFSLIGLGEKAGSGFDRFRQAASWAGVGGPVLEELEQPDRVRLTVRFSNDVSGTRRTGGGHGAAAQVIQSNDPVTLKAGANNSADSANDSADSANDSANEEPNLTGDERAVLEQMRSIPTASAEAIGQGQGLTRRQVQRIQGHLKDKGLIERVGGTRGYWNIKG